MPSCSGQFQSPIDIVTSLTQTNSSYGGLVPIFDNEDGTVSGVLSNNGHAPTVTLDKTQGGVTLTAGPLGQNTLCVLVEVDFSLSRFSQSPTLGIFSIW